MTNRVRVFAALAVLVAVVCAWVFLRTPPTVQQAALPVRPIPVPVPELVFSWGNAESSAARDGTGFFDRERRQMFLAKAAPHERPFVIELQSRALLPHPGLAAAASILKSDASAQILYVQFPQQLDEAERENIQKRGLELLQYVAGQAWSVRATSAALREALQDGSIRAVAAIDPRDKMHPSVFAQRVPKYAQSPEGALFAVIAQPGTDAAQFEKLGAVALRPSVLGPRFGVSLDWERVEALAASDAVAYIGYTAPPVHSRDTVTNESSNVIDVTAGAPNLSGAGIKVAVREIGRPQAHQDLEGQFELTESSGSPEGSEIRHATAVTGVVAAKGLVAPDAKGVAIGARVLSYALNDDPFGPSDIVDAGARGARISNHSYGPAGLEVWGDYDPLSADTDSALRANDLIGFYSGNQETGGIFKHIDFYCGAKNTICVTNNNSNAHAGDDDPAVTPRAGKSNTAEHGPMNDGRVKPDLAAFGDGIKLVLGINETYTSVGTSFSAPAATGMTALLFQHFNTTVGRLPSAPLTKAILLNTAADVGQPGPDAMIGYGIANIEAAVKLVSARASAQNTPFVEGVVKAGATSTFTLNVTSATELRATLVWFDPAGNPIAAKALVNDLDLELVSPGGTSFFPFSLNPASPEAAATATGANTVDNVEQTVVATPQTGAWTVRVKGTNVANGPQPFALAVTGGTFALDVVAVVNASPKSGAAPLVVSFDSTGSAGTITNYSWDFGDGTAPVSGATVTTLTHTYTAPGIYLATLTINDSSTASVLIRIDKSIQTALVKSAKATLSFKAPAGFEDDGLAFTLQAPGLIEPADVVKTKLKSGAYAGVVFFVNLGGGEDRNPEPERVFTIELDPKARAKVGKNSLKYNPKKGEIKVSVKTASLEDLFATLGMTREFGSTGAYRLPIEVENNTMIFRAVVPVKYKVTARSGSVKQVKQ